MDTERWLTFVLAQDKVVRATGYSLKAAAELLRLAAVRFQIRVRFSPYYLCRLDNNLRVVAKELIDPPKTIDGWECEWRTPINELKSSPQALTEFHIQEHTEWDGENLQAMLPGLAAQLAKKAGKGSGGPRINENWLPIMVEVGAWLERGEEAP